MHRWDPFNIYRLLAIALLLQVPSFLFCQTLKVDSLGQVAMAEKDPEKRVEAICEWAIKLAENKPDSALLLVEQTFPLAQSLNKPNLIVELSYSRALAYEFQEKIDSALIFYEETRQLAEQHELYANLSHALIQMGYLSQEKDEQAKGFQYLHEALKYAEKSENKDAKIRANNALGRSYSFIGKHDSSNIFINRAIEIQKDLGDKRILAELYVNLGNGYARKGDVPKSFECFNEALSLYEEINSKAGISQVNRNFGASHFFLGEYPETIDYFLKALKAVEGTQHDQEILTSLSYLGEAYMTMGDNENAADYWERSVEKWKEINGDKEDHQISEKMGRVYIAREQYEDALKSFLEAEELKKEGGLVASVSLYWNIANSAELSNKYEIAEEYYNKATQGPAIPSSYFPKVKSYLGLGKIREQKEDWTGALVNYKESYGLASGSEIKDVEMEAAAGLYRMYKKQNNASEALYYLEVSKTIQDSLYNEKNTKELARLEAGFEFEKEKQELAFAQEKELEEQSNLRRLLMIALGVAFLILLIGLFYFRSKQKANAELEKLNAQILSQKEKLEELDEAKSRFFTNISHEFRTPLTIISGMIDQINEKPDLWLKRGTKMIKQNTVSLLNLVNQILDLRKLESKELKVNLVNGDMVKYLKYITQSHESYAADKGLMLHFLSTEESISMDYDPDKTLRVISNLLSNAIKYTPDSGNVYFQIGKISKNKKDHLQIRVQDTGVGIPKEDLPHIFGRFYQVDDSSTRKGEGTGVGLALTQELVKLLGGNISADSTIGTGSVFTVELPIENNSNIQSADEFIFKEENKDEIKVIQPIAPVEEIIQNKKVTSTGKPNLLIVEDNADVRQYLVACLEDDYQLVLAENGQIGIDKAIEQIPDLIVSDVMMPEKDGFELTSALKEDERTNHIPIVLLTAKADFESKISGLEKGADAYLAKPFEKKELMIRLGKLLELRKSLQEKYAGYIPPKENISPTENETEIIQDPFLNKIHEVLEKEINNPDFDMVRLSRAVGMSRTQVFRKLKALTGKSASVYIRTYRLRKGKEMLQTTDLNVSEVAYEVGFTSLNYFSAAYFEEFGVRPSAERQ